MEDYKGIPFELHMSEQRIVRGDIYKARQEPSKGTLLLLHGYKGFKNWGMFPHVASELAEAVDVVALNFSHNGVGDNLMDFTELEKFAGDTYTKDLEDIQVIIADIHKHVGTDKPILLLGHSRGAGVSLIYALDHPTEITGVISWNGIAHVDLLTPENKAEMRATGHSYTLNGRTKQMMPLHLEILEDMERNEERFDIVGRIREASFPITLVQGMEDGERLLKGSEKLVANNPDIQWVKIPGGNHTFGSVHPYQGETEPLRMAIEETKGAIRSMLNL
ncbi:alpha/beta fold hydrolase [Paenibacillus sp. LMG 31461]|uniref:Alpha/beta fold hydrolase n=1 Tax=Paenibacillus plantarum TaxID=2654975 RepID=A0ABX1XI59_9BACL|nr:alpha/beta fold hydrolase [Paenibacillus plantarum]NOU68202.1 alpha/beta fold hydrolase [Paenibacillus plantarum]